jgi:flagellar hook-basal body complex protein FliE
MATINDILRTRNIPGIENNAGMEKPKKADDSGKVNFADTIKDFLDAVNEDQKVASQSVEDVILGKSETLADAMTKLEEANLSFQLMLEIKNKLVDAYNELNRMQV